MKIATIVGARPQFIKAAAVSREIKKHSSIEEIIIHTGQHYDMNMSDVFFKEMEIPKPKLNLDVNGLSHGAMTGQMLEKIEKVLMELKPDWVLTYGDTNSTLAGALAAKKLHLKAAHVEAGLRSFNMKMPEEINRILTDRICDVLFCPTDAAIANLKKEGFENFPVKIIRCGDVMQDAAIYYSKISEQHSKIISQLQLKEFVLCTLHREENTNDKAILSRLINSLNEINKQIPVVLPLHPRTKKIISNFNIELKVKVVDPVGYFDMIELLKYCKLVMTDSGGLQKEAFFFRKFCVTLREQTEWIELVERGFNKVVGSDERKIMDAFDYFLKAEADFNVNLYGNGNASAVIVESLMNA